MIPFYIIQNLTIINNCRVNEEYSYQARDDAEASAAVITPKSPHDQYK